MDTSARAGGLSAPEEGWFGCPAHEPELDAFDATLMAELIEAQAAEKPDQGEVLAVGPGRMDEDGDRIKMDVKVGDRVLFGKYSGQTVKVDGDELLVMKEDDLFAVVEQ